MAEEEASEILEYFTPDGNRRWEVMPMGDLNTSPTLVAITTKLTMEWYTIAKYRGLKNVASRIIFD